jgi:amino-acid N-acetyltransferase
VLVTIPVPRIERARTEDRGAIATLLERCGLPTAGLVDCGPELFVARDRDAIVGSAGLEVRGRDALLRSVAVDAANRGRRLGEQLTETALNRAQALGLDGVYLLTTTAERYFPRFGFEPVARDAVPPAVRESVEFRSACPASAIAMRRTFAVRPEA